MRFFGVGAALFLALWLGGCNPQGVALGESAPEISTKNLQGEAVKLENYRGKVVVLRFWAKGCASCVKEMPFLEELWREYEEELVILAINAQDSSREMEAFKEQYHLGYPLLKDDLDITTKRYGVVAIPTMFLIDKEGRLRDKIYGEQPWASTRGRILGIL
ncbi:MAG: TlpA family protein disulfide reductase [Wolinella succinogenes]|uniref:redoxin domain-containing protein n=1 Tax=Wolinella succinogenes TaxID=844 RepID=UPI0016B88C2A|nr:TlpA family protein disulfide reductase [Wolinella succinogenes]